MKKNIDKYEKNVPQHVRAALMDKGTKYKKGDVVQLIKTKDRDGVKPYSLAKVSDISVDKYKELLKSTFEQLLDALNIDYDELEGARKLSSFF